MTVIFPDRNISPSYFKAAPADSLLVRTIFFSIQGEGPLAGHPSVFVRLGGCNLGSKGLKAAGCEFCDTDFVIDKSKWMTFEQIMDEANLRVSEVAVRDFKNPLFVITGGEPLLQKNLIGFVEHAGYSDWRVQIESNGMYYLDLPSWVTMVVSPKLGSARSYPELKKAWFEDADCLKFVLEADPDSPYHNVPNYAFDFARIGPVYVSPIAVYAREMSAEEGERASIWSDLIDGPATARNYQYAAEYALKHNLRLSMQTHLFANMP